MFPRPFELAQVLTYGIGVLEQREFLSVVVGGAHLNGRESVLICEFGYPWVTSINYY